MNEAKQVGIAAKLYANDHEGRLPETFAQLMPDIVDDARLFQQMQLLTPGAKLDELPPKTVMMTKTFMKATWAFSIPWGKQERMVLVYPDLSVHVKQ